MTTLLQNYAAGQWHSGTGAGTPLFDPVLGTELVRVDATGLDIPAAFAFARNTGGAALRAMSYAQRAAMLGAVGKVLQAHRDAYYEISTANSGTVKNDTAIDVDGGIYTLGYYAKAGVGLGERRFMLDGDAVGLAKDGSFHSQHVLTPTRGLALFINAFNFPSWGLWEKAAPALLSGVPVVIKPGTATAWLTQRMVKDVVDAGVLPAGALSVICGSSAGLLDALEHFDVLSFTGSADTAALIRSHANVVAKSIRVNIEADSVNSALLLPDATPSADVLDLFIKEVAKEMTQKSGQKCTAVRRILVPQAHYQTVAEALSARLAKTSVGNPRNETVRMGSLVSRAQFNAVKDGIAHLSSQSGISVVYQGSAPLVDADPAVACIVQPTLLGCADPDAGSVIHQTEVFGPVATLMPYRDTAHALYIVRRGQGSLVMSLYGDNPAALSSAALELADCHGRVHVISPDMAAANTGHGNVMPQSLHGGPGRAGGGEELGGLRALNFYHRRSAIQSGSGVLAALKN